MPETSAHGRVFGLHFLKTQKIFLKTQTANVSPFWSPFLTTAEATKMDLSLPQMEGFFLLDRPKGELGFSVLRHNLIATVHNPDPPGKFTSTTFRVCNMETFGVPDTAEQPREQQNRPVLAKRIQAVR